jgi:membrane fusion protein (multidrug efflux system)
VRLTRHEAVALVLVPVLATLAAACGQAGDAPPSGDASRGSSAVPSAQERSVIVAPVEARAFERTLALPADLTAFQDVAIHARVSGFIESIAVDRGSVVRRGAPLARIVAPELQSQHREAEAEVQSAEATLAEAQAALASSASTFARLQRASATPGVVAGNDLEVAQQVVEAARARAGAATKNVEARREAARSVRETEAYLHVTAPFDGVVTERAAHVGSLVGPASGAIVRMQQVSPLRLVAPIPEAHVGTAAVGQSVEFTVTAFPGETFTGRLARLAQALDPRTRTMAVEMDVANGAGRLAPGMFAEVRWPVRRAGTSLFVPRSAVATTTERTFVVRVKDGVAEWVDVKRGAGMGDVIEILGPVAAGDEVALRATDELRQGTRVRATRQPG